MALEQRRNLIRIPAEQDVPVTPRIRKLIDTPQFQRLNRISQLGLVSKVYPGATHSRFEHSLGAYRNALFFLKQLSSDPVFQEVVSVTDAEMYLVAALLHDIAHWPFCHPIEDIGLENIPTHEELAKEYLNSPEIQQVLSDEFGFSAQEVAGLLSEKSSEQSKSILQSLLSGPIDIDKMDYLFRDSHHAGVPYGKNFDPQRLIGSLCLNSEKTGLAITEKGKTASEMMVFARYVMFSEVYWHHAVRSATAMLQRIVYELRDNLNLQSLLSSTDQNFEQLVNVSSRLHFDQDIPELVDGLFGSKRLLYKRLANYSCFESPEIYEQLARKPFSWLVKSARKFAELLSKKLSMDFPKTYVLFDAPPASLEVQFEIEIYYQKEDSYRWLSEVSPVVKTLAERQFDDFVKRVRLFVHPKIADKVRQIEEIDSLVLESISAANDR